jgi:hypothetical protein
MRLKVLHESRMDIATIETIRKVLADKGYKVTWGQIESPHLAHARIIYLDKVVTISLFERNWPEVTIDLGVMGKGIQDMEKLDISEDGFFEKITNFLERHGIEPVDLRRTTAERSAAS